MLISGSSLLDLLLLFGQTRKGECWHNFHNINHLAFHEKVKVYYYHDGFLACTDGRKDGTRPAGFGHTKVTMTLLLSIFDCDNILGCSSHPCECFFILECQVFASNYSDSVTVDGLHPASRYQHLREINSCWKQNHHPGLHKLWYPTIRIRARGVNSEHMENMEMFSCSPT